ncbi:MAG TPA: diguanylate cyclase, partial [Rhodospirillales bacterium]|nr:diguanylate cyclase [Rhodospirillales bacterium]
MAPVVALFVLVLAGIVVMTMLAARGGDEDAREASRRAAAWTITAAKNRLGDLTLDYAQSDESFVHLQDPVDERWAKANIGSTAHQIYVIEHVYVFDREDRLVFSSHRPPPAADDASLEVDVHKDLGRLLAAARAAGSKDPWKGLEVRPVVLHGHVHLAAAALIQPQDATNAIPPDQTSVLVLVRDFTPHFLSRLGGPDTLPLLRISMAPDAAPGELLLPLTFGEPPRPVGYMIWRPQLPGTQLLHAAAAPVAGTGLLMLALLGLVLNRARRAGLALDDAVADLSRARATLEQEVEARTAELREAEARYRGIVENAVEGIFQLTPAGRFINANPAMARILGYNSPEHMLTNATANAILPGQTRAAFDRVIGAFGKVADFVSEVVRPDGTKTWISQNTRAVLGADGSPAYYEGLAVDITARREAEENLIKNAFHDALTGLPNRFLFFERLSQVVASRQRGSGAPFAVLFLDCDRFKLINDSFGHLSGDNLLISLSRRLSQRLRPADMLARLGGDEFAVLIEGTGMPDGALALADRLHDACRQPMELDGHEVFVGLSIGIAVGREGAYQEAHAVL